MHEMEKRWILAAQQGNESRFFGYLVKEHQLAVRGYLRRLTKGNAALSDDLAQETFLSAYKKITSYNNTGSFKSWLFSIAYRNFLMHMRKNSSNPLMNFPTENI
ncbi:MAG: sigma-70 family RNA polymerase sigma factor, partial [Kordiimonadaceae bacterium]|nr:sigma-70 family RNA polymerase sigma factor [Kordiimonadaceae bacterium]